MCHILRVNFSRIFLKKILNFYVVSWEKYDAQDDN